uniref:hypothetical protein n=1 Tax=Acinetobacter indicus TaxID=756892 RepID=UPI001C08941D
MARKYARNLGSAEWDFQVPIGGSERDPTALLLTKIDQEGASANKESSKEGGEFDVVLLPGAHNTEWATLRSELNDMRQDIMETLTHHRLMLSELQKLQEEIGSSLSSHS